MNINSKITILLHSPRLLLPVNIPIDKQIVLDSKRNMCNNLSRISIHSYYMRDPIHNQFGQGEFYDQNNEPHMELG